MDFALSCMVRNIGFSSTNQTIPVRIKRFQYELADSSYKKQKTHCFFQRNLRFLKKKKQKQKSALLQRLTRSTGFQTLGQWKTATTSGAVLVGGR